MINGIHSLIYARDADQLRAFFRDILGFRSVDVGRGWLIFALPPAELAIHPADEKGSSPPQLRHELYLMCDDIHATIHELKAKGVECDPIHEEGWGSVTSITVSGAGKLGLYQPKHPTALPKDEQDHSD